MEKQFDINKVKEIRKSYTSDTYSEDFTKEHLWQLFEFINSPIVEEKQLFCGYDKASLLCAIEIIDSIKDRG